MSNEIEKNKKYFDENGFVKIPGIAKCQELKNLQNLIFDLVNWRLKRLGLERSTENIHQLNKALVELIDIDRINSMFIFETLNSSIELYRLVTNTKIAEFAESWLGTNSKPILNNVDVRFTGPNTLDVTDYPWHQDSHYNRLKSTRSFVMWISVFPTTHELGPVTALKGSHVKGMRERTDFIFPSGRKVFSVKIEDSNAYEQQSTPELEEGDAILLDMNTIHKSGLNRTKDSIRWSSQIRWHDAFCEEYPPNADGKFPDTAHG